MIREFTQNLCDACVRTIETTDDVLTWTSEPSPFGEKGSMRLMLNGKMAGEYSICLDTIVDKQTGRTSYHVSLGKICRIDFIE